MAIDLNQEKQRHLSTQEMYDILHFAAQSAEDNGFVNSFVFNRALFEYAAIILYPDRKEEIGALVSANINDAWDSLVADGTIDDMLDNYSLDMEMLGDEGNIWLEEFTKYLHSARGLLNSFQMFSGDIVGAAVERFKSAASDGNAQQILEFADKWGMNNGDGRPEAQAKRAAKEESEEKVVELFKEEEKESSEGEEPLFTL